MVASWGLSLFKSNHLQKIVRANMYEVLKNMICALALSVFAEFSGLTIDVYQTQRSTGKMQTQMVVDCS